MGSNVEKHNQLQLRSRSYMFEFVGSATSAITNLSTMNTFFCDLVMSWQCHWFLVMAHILSSSERAILYVQIRTNVLGRGVRTCEGAVASRSPPKQKSPASPFNVARRSLQRSLFVYPVPKSDDMVGQILWRGKVCRW